MYRKHFLSPIVIGFRLRLRASIICMRIASFIISCRHRVRGGTSSAFVPSSRRDGTIVMHGGVPIIAQVCPHQMASKAEYCGTTSRPSKSSADGVLKPMPLHHLRQILIIRIFCSKFTLLSSAGSRY